MNYLRHPGMAGRGWQRPERSPEMMARFQTWQQSPAGLQWQQRQGQAGPQMGQRRPPWANGQPMGQQRSMMGQMRPPVSQVMGQMGPQWGLNPTQGQFAPTIQDGPVNALMAPQKGFKGYQPVSPAQPKKGAVGPYRPPVNALRGY